MNTPFLTEKSGSLLLRVYVSPRAKKSLIAGVYDEKLKVLLAAPPADGKANKELIRFISEVLGCPKSSVTLTKGAASKEKVLQISDLSLESADAAIQKQLS